MDANSGKVFTEFFFLELSWFDRFIHLIEGGDLFTACCWVY